MRRGEDPYGLTRSLTPRRIFRESCVLAVSPLLRELIVALPPSQPIYAPEAADERLLLLLVV